MDKNAVKRLACNCCFGEEYSSLHGKTIIGCTEDNVWCNDCIAEKCERYTDKNNANENERMYYAGVDMTDWDFSYKKDDPQFIYKAFIALCNFAEELSGCAGCPLNQLCFSSRLGSNDGVKFWDKVHKELSEVKL